MTKMKNDYIRCIDLKVGDIFYNADDIIMVVIEIDADISNPDVFRYKGRALNSREILEYGIYSVDAIYREVWLYTGRNRGSFLAGFRFAMRLCLKHMGIFDIENAGLDNPFIVHTTMMEQYKSWMKNEGYYM